MLSFSAAFIPAMPVLLGVAPDILANSIGGLVGGIVGGIVGARREIRQSFAAQIRAAITTHEDSCDRKG